MELGAAPLHVGRSVLSQAALPVAAGLVAVAFAAALPTWRALGIEPAQALHEE